MKNQITILDDYLNNGAKGLSGVLMIWLFLGSLAILKTPLYLKDLTTGTFCLLGLILIYILILTKKVLFVENGLIFQGLIFRRRILFKKEIDLHNVKALLIYDNTKKVVIPWWINMTANMLTDEAAYSLKLEKISGKEKYLISVKNFDSKKNALRFFKSNTELEIKNCG